MINELREKFNSQFSEEMYQAYLAEMHGKYNFPIDFRLSETPVFLEKSLVHNMLDASNTIIDFIVNEDIKTLTQPTIEPEFDVPNENEHTHFLAIDFGICQNEKGEIVPQLIELQGFPSLFNYMTHIGETWKKHFAVPASMNYLLTPKGFDYYFEQLKKVILNGHDPKEVVLLEIEPLKQSTAIDFVVAEHQLGIKVLCLSEVVVQGKDVFYRTEPGLQQIKRIYNRVIFDELKQRPDLKTQFDFTKTYNIEWAGHPNWFARISKFLMPFLPASPFIPECKLLSAFDQWPQNLEDYVLKPLYSFSGSGVVIDVTVNDLNQIPKQDLDKYMLQRKVSYAPIIKTAEEPTEYSKIEFRVLCLWPDNTPKPEPMIHLMRMSKGKMIGVKYNKNKRWVGSSVAFFEL